MDVECSQFTFFQHFSVVDLFSLRACTKKKKVACLIINLGILEQMKYDFSVVVFFYYEPGPGKKVLHLIRNLGIKNY